MTQAQTKKTCAVITVGDVFVDLVLTGFPHWPQPGEESFAQELRRDLGGGAAITACGLAKLGLHTAICTVVGSADGEGVIERLRAYGVDTGRIRLHLSEPTGLTVAVSTATERSFFTYAGANRLLDELLTVPQAQHDLLQARHVHLALPVDPELLLELTTLLHAAGCTVSLDVGWQKAWLEDGRCWPALRELDLFLPNEREAALLTGHTNPAALLQAFQDAGLRGVALKLGAQGAMLLWDDQTYVCAPHRVEPVDTTGAGDCFNAGFLYTLLQNEPPQRCLQIANICGALSTQGLGGLAAFPSLSELQQELARL